MELVGLAAGSGAALQVAHVATFLCYDEGALELAGVGLVDAEVSHQLHGTVHTLGDVGKGAVAEYG